MQAAIVRIQTLGGVTQTAGLTLRFDTGSWDASDPKGLLLAFSGSLDLTIPNLVALRSSNNNVAQLQGFNKNTAKVDDEGGGLIFQSTLSYSITWQIEKIY